MKSEILVGPNVNDDHNCFVVITILPLPGLVNYIMFNLANKVQIAVKLHFPCANFSLIMVSDQGHSGF